MAKEKAKIIKLEIPKVDNEIKLIDVASIMREQFGLPPKRPKEEEGCKPLKGAE
jgi:hypothetical protein